MAILSMLLSTAYPQGMWESIIWAFEGATNNYVWAVVLLTVVIRLLWSPLDTYNRRITAKNAEMNAKIQPELKKLQEKYGNDKQTLNQKTSELYKRNNFNVMGSCGFMLIFMALNLVIFFTLFSGLNNIASYKIYTNYENLKENYANTLYLADAHTSEFEEFYNQEKEVEFRTFTTTDGEGNVTKKIGLFEKSSTTTDNPLFAEEFLSIDDFEKKDKVDPANPEDKQKANEYINELITKLKEDVLKTIPSETEGGEETKVTLFDEVTKAAMPLVVSEYQRTKESFLWIENIWIADNPFSSSIFDYSTFASNARNRVQAGEETIYNAFMGNLRQTQSRANGYFILPALTLVVSFLSMWLSQFLLGKKAKEGAKQGKVMQIIMPIIMGVFAILYNSVFAIYMLTSQIISTALLPLQQLIVKKLGDRAEKKKLQKTNNDIDYRRKV